MKKYCYGSDEESFTSASYNTREDAIEEGREEFDNEDVFYTGVIRELKVTGIVDVDNVIDSIDEELYEQLPSDYEDLVECKDKARFNYELQELIARHLKCPYFAVYDIEHHQVIENQ